MVPKATFTITGEIDEFERVDNLYKSMKREGIKFFKNWKMSVNVEFIEEEGEKK